MALSLNLMVAVCENMGIGKNNNLPWRLKTEMAYFTKMTTSTEDETKQNVVIMGRKTWDSIPPRYKPLGGRINFVLSRSKLDLGDSGYAFTNFGDVVRKLQDEEFKKKYEKVWVIGGSRIYEEAMKSKYFHRLYLTKIKKHFDCDTFFPSLGKHLQEICDSQVPEDIQQENDIKFLYKVYENTEFKPE